MHKVRQHLRLKGSRDYLALFSVTVTSVLLLAFLGLSAIMLLVGREQALDERANRRCEAGAPPGATGWMLRRNGDTYFCIYGRDGRRIGEMLRVRRSDL